MSDSAIAEPIGLMVSLVAAVEGDLETERIREVVSSVAGGRAKSRQMAAALRARPGVLRDGLSPAPRAVADLLIGLRRAGATSISPPHCKECGKELRTYQRRGQDWYCAVCGPRPEGCAVCGNMRRVATRDRAGRPRCRRCPDADPRDPIAVICAQVTALDPDANAEAIAEAVRAVASRPSHQQRLARALEENPALLTGAGHLAPVPAVLRLVELLNASGITAVVRPLCPRCHRAVHLHRPLDGERVCRSCTAKSRAELCARCGALREPAIRDQQGRPLCPSCLVADPANFEICVNCGRRRPVGTRSEHGPLCAACPPLPILVCSICGESAPCGISRLTGQPWCFTCQRRSVPCSRCRQIRPVRSGTLEEPRCERCTEPAFPSDCPTCADRPRAGQCPACRLDRRLRELLVAPDGSIHPALGPLHNALAATEPPTTALRWLTRPIVSTLLADVAAGRRDLSHEELDGLPQTPTLDHLRAVLVSSGTLAPRDEHMARLERLLDELLATRSDPAERQVLHHYAVWHLLRRLRRRNSAKAITHGQLAALRQQVRSAIALLDWLAGEDLTLATCRQGDLERWLCREDVNHHHPGNFIRWAAKQRLTDLVFPASRWQGPTSALDDQARWHATRRLLHDDTLPSRDRFAGLLVLLYAQKTATISRLTTDCLHAVNGTVRIRLGKVPITLPDPVADLAVKLTTDRRGHATTAADAASPWLFPGGQPGRPVSAGQLQQRLKALGVGSRQAKNTALFQLAGELPAALLARLLGIGISAAVAWQRISSGDWMAYAAEISRRSQADDPDRVGTPLRTAADRSETSTIRG